ncbi:nose resistant to fluoxetine protein 6-like isoform X2 [Belonocnema kinseyi]|uniref:nose resistant to fluoxetine protein 6-like isoform X2 n=1 Tax=Belonocnema kinseyi TaxID=2817044 RepID=UPI00143D43BE|nr:nose resistant to fluoxetine protein 6-like isoform X2 [Belonocnema kinseyi]
MDFMQKIFLLLILLRYLVTMGDCQKSVEKIEDIFEELEPKSLLATFTETEKWYEYPKESCGEQFLTYINSIIEEETWALKMLDSSSKIPSGILLGNVKDLGMFDECDSVQAVKGNIKIRGRHCMYRVNLTNQKISTSVSPTWSICVPSACNADDVETFLTRAINDLEFANDLEITRASATCSSVGPQRWSKGSITSMALFSIFVIFLIICTFLDIIQNSNPLQSAVVSNLTELSLYKSAHNILNMNADSNSFSALYGIRSLSMCWIVLVHECMITIMKWLKSWKSLYIRMGLFAVDTFFALSGLLVTYSFLKDMSTGRKFNIFKFYFHRYIRLTPPMAALLTFLIFIIPHLGSGPMWEEFESTKKCDEKWWTFLMYTNNYVDAEYLCLNHLWYLAADMQLFFISPLILYPLTKKPKLGIAIWCLLFVSQIAIPAAIIAMNQYTSTWELDVSDEKRQSSFKNVYAVAHTRGGSWLVGVLFGYIISTQRSDLKKKTIYFGWVCCAISLTFCTLGTIFSQPQEYVYNVVWESVFTSISRPLWATSIAWIVLACIRGHGGPINTFLSLPIFIPISRVSYSVYLVHVTIMQIKVFATRTPHYFSGFQLFNNFLDNLVLAIVIAFFWSLLFEVPILTLEKIIFRRKNSNEKSKRFCL